MKFQLEFEFKTEAKSLYSAWLDSNSHSEMTGGDAIINNVVGAEFSAWDEYIWGKNIELKPYSYIKQSWRTSQFLEDQEDSILELFIKDLENGNCHLTLVHSNLTESSSDKAYEKGWIESYFEPMEDYFK